MFEHGNKNEHAKACSFFYNRKKALQQGTVLTVPLAFPWGKVDFLRFTAEKTDEGLF